MPPRKIDPYKLYSHLQRAAARKYPSQQDIDDLLPPVDVDFAPYFERIIPKDLPLFKDSRRGDIKIHWQTLVSAARGRPEAVALLNLLISYLRRDTPYTAQAWSLFDRLWREYTDPLLAAIQPRNLVSAFRTFADHEPDDKRRLLAKLCFTYAHMLKMYETERLNEGHSLSEIQFDIPAPCPNIGVRELWGVRYGGDNSLEILHILLAEEIMSDEVLGPMLLSLLSIVQSGDSIFSRFDRRRAECNFQTDTERNWSFAFNPLDADDTEA